MQLIQRPEGHQFSGNVTEFIISSSEDVTINLWNSTFGFQFSETYIPDADGLVKVDFSELLTSLLEVKIPDSSPVFIQDKAQLNINASIVGLLGFSFHIIKGGVRDLSKTADEFLQENFLTWQPQVKQVKAIQPEWITCHSPLSKVKVKAYFWDKRSEESYLTAKLLRAVCSVDVSFQHINSLFDKQVTYYDIWIEDFSGIRSSYVQRYILNTDYHENEQFFIFENSLGGIDSVLMTGETNSKKKPKALVGKINGSEIEYGMDFSVIYTQNTGHIDSKHKASWLQDFFLSRRKKLLSDGFFLPIVMVKNTIKESTSEDIVSFSFDFRLSKQSKYQNLNRSMDDIPINLEISNSGDLFFLAPRLSEFPGLALSDTLTFPVQLRYTEEWGQVTYATVKADLLSAVVAMGYVHGSEVVGNAAKLGGISALNYARTDIEETFEEGVTFKSSAKFNKHVFYSPDTTEDLLNLRRYGENHTLLNMMAPPQKSWGKAKECTLALVRGDNNEYFMDLYNMDYGDVDAGNYMDYGDARMGIRLQKRGGGHYTPFNIEYSAGAEKYSAIEVLPNGTNSSNETSVGVNDFIVRRNQTVCGYIKNSGPFVDGFSGAGWSIGHGALKDSLTVGDITVRRSAKFYELMINKIRSGNGSYWFSDGAKINKISSEDSTGYTVELDDELGNPFITGQKIRCQVWNGAGVKFYEATISWAGNVTYPNLIKLNKIGYVGDVPEIGDEIVRVSGGAVYITSNDNSSPYLDVVYDMNVKARLGRLTGINDSDFGGNLKGYGLYCDNVYLKGLMKLSAGSSISFSDVVGGQSKIDAVQGDADTAIVNAGLAQTKANTAHALAELKITENQATVITRNAITTQYIAALGLKVGDQIQMGANAVISWDKVTGTGNVETTDGARDKANGAKSSAISTAATDATAKANAAKAAAISVANTAQAKANSAYSLANTKITSTQATIITKSTVTAAYINAFSLNANSIKTGTLSADRLNINVLKTKLITAGNINALTLNVIKGKIGGFTIASSNLSSISTIGGGPHGLHFDAHNSLIQLIRNTSNLNSTAKIEFKFGNTLSGSIEAVGSSVAASKGLIFSTTSQHNFNVNNVVKMNIDKNSIDSMAHFNFFDTAMFHDNVDFEGALIHDIYANAGSTSSSTPRSIDVSSRSALLLGSSAGGRYYKFTGAINGQILYIINRNDSSDIHIRGFLEDSGSSTSYFTVGGGSSLIAMYIESAFYNATRKGGWWVVLGKYDQNW